MASNLTKYKKDIGGIKVSEGVIEMSTDSLMDIYRDVWENATRTIEIDESNQRIMSIIATELINRGYSISEEVELVFRKNE